MAEFPYTTVPGKIKPLLDKMRTVGIPPKVTYQWLKTIGFTSSNDSSLIGVLKFIGFIDGSQAPTSKWSQYRGASNKSVLGAAVREGYADLFAVYPDANQRPRSELESVFSTSTKGGREVINKLVSTFKSLADEADFSSVETQTDLNVAAGPLHTPVAAPPDNVGSSARATTGKSGPSLHVDIQIHISPESPPEQIEQIFASMAKHLYGSKPA